MSFGAEFWGPLAAQAGGSILSGIFGGSGSTPKETKIQKTQRNLIDQLIASLSGNGPYSDLYKADEQTFNKSFVQPAQERFRNQIAPQIQQQYIASGQQRGTGLEDQLLRAGVDLNSLLDQHYMDFQQGALNRQQNSIANILGQSAGASQQPSFGQNVMSSLSGYLSSPTFANTTADMFKNNTTAPNNAPPRKGYERPWMDYQLGDKRWGQPQ